MEIELIEQASSEISEYNATEAGLADLRARMANVEYCVTTTAGMAIAKADRAEVRGLRTGLENMRKKIKAPALAHAKLIDEEAKRITAALLELEEPIDAQIKAEEQRKETEKAEREAAERNRITEIHRRIAEIRSYQALAAGCRTSAAIQTLIDKLAEIELTGFEEFDDEACQARVDTMHRMEEAHAQKFADEAERARVKAEQDAAAAELAKARAELAVAKAEQDAIAKAHRDAAIAEADKLATARQAFEDEQAKAKAERQAFDERVKAKQAEDDLAAYKEALAPVVIAQYAIENVANLAQVCEIVQTMDSSKSPPDDSEADPDPVSQEAEEMITITRREYERLTDRDHWLDCLESAGVDNWSGMEEAIAIRNKDNAAEA